MVKLNRYKWLFGLMWILPLLFIKSLNAQNKYSLVFRPVDIDSGALAKLKLTSSFSSKLQCDDYLMQLPVLLQARGFISASVDSVAVDTNKTTAFLFLGKEFELAGIHIPQEYLPNLQQAGFDKKLSQGLHFKQYRTLQQKLLDQFENAGYPFAQIKLDSISITGPSIRALLNIDKGMFYRFDSIRLLGPAKISRNFIHRYLNIERGSVYSQQKLAKINQRLLELPFLQQAQPWDVTMLNTGSIINLYLVPKKSNQVNVLAGFLPDNQQLGGGKLLFTIDANLQLKNAFGSGENIGLVWQQIQPRSPRLNLLYQQPFLFNSPFGFDFTFDLFKKDSSFLNLNSQLGVRYSISGNQSAKLSIQNQQTTVLQIDTFSIKASRRLPEVADVSSVNLAVDYENNTTNYRFNPVKGNEFAISVGVGSKKIRKNASIVRLKDPGFDFNTLYDSLQLNTYQVRAKLVAAHYFTMGRQSVLKAGINTAIYQSPNNFKNELFQIGGYKLLRGFDEESIYANKYAVGTLEYRYLLGINSYFFGFTDVGWSQFKDLQFQFSNSYLGGGIGLAFETKGGIFNVSYAAGKRNQVPFNIKESKIHFGYVSVF